MKRILIAVLLLNVTLVHAQSNFKGWLIDANVGMRLGGKVSDLSDLKTGFHLDGGIGYMITNTFGIKFDTGADTYKAVRSSDGKIDKSYSIRGTIEGLVSLSNLFRFGGDKFDLTFHSGFGFTTHTNRSVREGDKSNGVVWKDASLKGNDDYVNIQFGLTPRYNISEVLSINLNYAFLLLPIQDRYVDLAFDKSNAVGDLGSIQNISLGIQYRIPKPSKARFE